MELTELQRNRVLRHKFENVNIETFHQHVETIYPQMQKLTWKIMSMFVISYVCEQRFSLISSNHSRFRPHLTYAHLNSTLKVEAAQSLLQYH